MWSRRHFLTASAAAAGLAALPARAAEAAVAADAASRLLIDAGPDPRALAARALDAARSAGASYADVRLTRECKRAADNYNNIDQEEVLAVGVRALIDGRWGFAASPVWTADEVARLGREAAAQARLDASKRRPVVEFAPAPAVRDGVWVAPVVRDPFAMPVDELVDYIQGLVLATRRIPGASLAMRCVFERMEKAFASTDGSYYTQTTFNTSGRFLVSYRKPDRTFDGMMEADFLTPSGRGMEHFTSHALRDMPRQLIDAMLAEAAIPMKAADVGRRTVVFDALTMAKLLDGTIGVATELDRAMGLEANAVGTSYLSDPRAMAGTFEAGSPLLNVTADRSLPGGVATVRWDDEGVAPVEYPVVDAGTLVDFHTTRESASWLAPYYAARHTPLRSRGCAVAMSALAVPLVGIPNITLRPSAGSDTFDDLVRGVEDGVAIMRGGVFMDFQALNGAGGGSAYEIKNGKRVSRLMGASYLLRAPEFWRNLAAVAGAGDMRETGLMEWKGEPVQFLSHTTRAVSGVVKNVAMFNGARGA